MSISNLIEFLFIFSPVGWVHMNNNAQEGQTALLKQKRFLPFFLTQFLGAFNDNLYKNALMLMLAFSGVSVLGLESAPLLNFGAFLFIVPFFIFSAFAGQLADKFEMSRIIRYTKLGEVAIMLTAGVALWFNQYLALLALLFLMGTQSALFGPAKYAILPKVLDDSELVGGNALVEMGTFISILCGTILAGVILAFGETAKPILIFLVVSVAIAGYIASRAIPAVSVSAPDIRLNFNIFSETLNVLKKAKADRPIFLSVLAISWFWFLGASYLTQIPVVGMEIIGTDESGVTLLLAFFTIGIGLGSILCERLSGKVVELGIVPFGTLGLTLFGMDLFFALPSAPAEQTLSVWNMLSQGYTLRILLDVAGLGVFGGFFIVPLYAYIQQRSNENERAQIIAANNILNALLMVISALAGMILLGMLGLSVAQYFLLIAVVNLLVAFYVYSQVTEFAIRCCVWILSRTIYRVNYTNLERIPSQGGVLLVCNHISFMDALVLAGSVRRPTRFVMDSRIFKSPALGWFFRLSKTIPIAPQKSDPNTYYQAFETIASELEAGNVVCIFPEGKLTTDGEVDTFKRGVEMILERTPVPVVPMALGGLWGSFFSHKGGPAFSRLPKRFWSKITLTVGEALPAQEASALILEEKVKALRTHA